MVKDQERRAVPEEEGPRRPSKRFVVCRVRWWCGGEALSGTNEDVWAVLVTWPFGAAWLGKRGSRAL